MPDATKATRDRIKKMSKEYSLDERRDASDQHRANDPRRPYDRDYARILHSSSFRRLQGKTQVLSLGHSDFYRTRLTHSLEAAQIGRGIRDHLHVRHKHLAFLLPPRSLIEASALAHDIGHPPFGHYGERQLNLLMREHGGFEGNGQTLRILTALETGAPRHGLNLTRRTLLAVLKYPVAYSASLQLRGYPKEGPCTPHPRIGLEPPKCYLDTENDTVTWILNPLSEKERAWLRDLKTPTKSDELAKPRNKSLDATIMELADDIAYGVHDLEDALRLEQIGPDEVTSKEYGLRALLAKSVAPQTDVIAGLLSREARKRKDAIGSLVNALVTSIRIESNDPRGQQGLKCGLLAYRAEMPAPQRDLLRTLKSLVHEELIKRPVPRQIESRGAFMIRQVWDVLVGMPADVLPSDQKSSWDAAGRDSSLQHRILCDYVAGCTDTYITQLYERLYQPHHGSPFDIQ